MKSKIRNARSSLVAMAICAFAATTACDLRFGSSGAYTRPRPVSEFPDPPARVARIGYVSGLVSVLPAGENTWAPGVLNRPLTIGDGVWAEPGARAELQLDKATMRLGSRTSVQFSDLDDRIIQLKLKHGTISIRLRRLDLSDRIEIDTPKAAVTLSLPGEYRFDVRGSTGDTYVSVRAGEAEVTLPNGALTIAAGKRTKFTGTSHIWATTSLAPGRDEFDQFCLTRDERQERGESTKYLPAGVIGYEDLDEHGSWLVNSELGPYWTPRSVRDGWAPYRFGHWEWIEPWGWTWIDDAPWGFATSHYGRWTFLEDRWRWIPGARRPEPVYAPALAVFAGGGRPDFRYFYWIGAAGVSWFPLGPGETYLPAYRCSESYLGNVNAGSTVIQNLAAFSETEFARQNFVNRTVPGAVTAVSREVFISAQLVARAAVSVSARDAAALQITGPASPMAPIRESLIARNEANALVPQPPPTVLEREVIVRRMHEPVLISFVVRKPLLDARPGYPLDPSILGELRAAESHKPGAVVPPTKLDPRTMKIQTEAQAAPPKPVPGKRSSEM